VRIGVRALGLRPSGHLGWRLLGRAHLSRPDDDELVERADTIVLARVTGGDMNPDYGYRHIRFVPVELIKGSVLRALVDLPTPPWRARR
jgi:hypothetical protein